MRIGSIVVRCYEFDKMAAFWQQALRVWMYLMHRGCAPGGSPELAELRERHSGHILAMMRAGISMRTIRRHRLDDPRITDEMRVVLVAAAKERQGKAWFRRPEEQRKRPELTVRTNRRAYVLPRQIAMYIK